MSSTTEPTQRSEPMVPPPAKRLKPLPDHDQDHDQTPVHCPRCDSSNTKFCYYNNYSLSQPRYFCKGCRRYWTKGGTLRNIPIGGVSRKSKKMSSSSTTTVHHHQRRRELPQQNSNYDKLAILSDGNAISPNSIGLQLSNPVSPIRFSENPDFMFEDLTIDFMERGGGDHYPSSVHLATVGYNPNGDYSSYGPMDTSGIHRPGPFGEMMSYYDDRYEKLMINGDDVKPKLLDFEWRDQTGCHSDLHGSGVGRNGSSGYHLLGLGSSWAGLVNGYGSSSTI
ncbi:hypothetical protein M8C21_021553 [Ambrosia artemisiifolia]|uniref:Dof zinc finger protein n=1 Tax=Ambrosia artemisiifolia TaxID=4212 RepID=A0AAD5D3A7_AMBAR|nr:hypothetical protein M8C21_021553 [Ambrosia artemisiifolia]